MRLALVAILALMTGVAPAYGEQPCDIPEPFVELATALPRVGEAIGSQRRLEVVVATTADPDRTKTAGRSYPFALQEALQRRLPDVAVRVTVHVDAKRTAAEAARGLGGVVRSTKAHLVVWQVGTVDAMRGVDVEDFSEGLARGIREVHAAGADLLLLNPQFSPQMEFFVDGRTFLRAVQWAAQVGDVPVFDRQGLMRHWSDVGAFDLTSYKRDSETFASVHRCLGEALAAMIAKAEPVSEPKPTD